MKEKIHIILQNNPRISPILESIRLLGGRALLVGGAVRDIFLEREYKDIDIEVYGLDAQALFTVLTKHGAVSLVGKAFGVYRVHGLDIDWSLPRLDSFGRKPVVTIDHTMSYAQSFSRRDVTINAMGIDLFSGQLIDPFNGKKDLTQKVLRSPDTNFFTQDPLRFYRVMSFIARFDMTPDAQLNNVCMQMDLSGVSKQRIEQEFEKMLLQSELPSKGLRWIESIGRLRQLLPELADCIGVPQNNFWHPEGDVFEHAMQTLDAAARRSKKYSSQLDKLILMYASLCHDLGKKETTQNIFGQYKSIGHEQPSAQKAELLLGRITNKKAIIASVKKLVAHHMKPAQFIHNNAKKSAYRRLASLLAPETTLFLLAELAHADKQGRNQFCHIPLMVEYADIQLFIMRAQDAKVLYYPQEELLQGADIIHLIKPGPQMGEALKFAYNFQIEHDVTDKRVLITQVKEYLKKNLHNKY